MAGRDKLLEQVDGLPLVARQTRLARRVTIGPVIVTLPPRPHPRYDVLRGLDATLLAVADAAEGINASLRAGIDAVPDGLDWAMVLLADLPALTEDDLNTMLQAIDYKSDTRIYRGCTQAGAPGHPIVFHRDLFPLFSQLHGDTGGRNIIAAHHDRLTLVPLNADHALLDLDTPAQWDAWHARNRPNQTS